MAKFYIKVSRDNLELIEAVAETQAELARLLGVNISCVNHGLKRNEQGGRSVYKVVEM